MQKKWYKWTGDVLDKSFNKLICIESGCVTTYGFDNQVFTSQRPYTESTNDWVENIIPNSDMWVQISDAEAFAELL